MDYGIISDLDGVLVDTERLHCASYMEVLGRYDVPIAEEEYYERWTRRGETIKEFIADRGLALDPDKIRGEKAKAYQRKLLNSAYENTLLIDGAAEVLDELKAFYRLALATASRRPDVNLVMELAGLTGYFEGRIVSLTESLKPKPDPACFLMAAGMLGMEPAHCLVVEDAEKGIVAAKRAGMKALAIPTAYTRNNDFKQADRIVQSIKDVKPELVAEILSQP